MKTIITAYPHSLKIFSPTLNSPSGSENPLPNFTTAYTHCALKTIRIDYSRTLVLLKTYDNLNSFIP